MKEKKLLCVRVLDITDSIVPEMCKCPANAQDVNAALLFLKPGMKIHVNYEVCIFNEDGTIVTPFETINMKDYE